jgi:alpha-L-rhamnosidase
MKIFHLFRSCLVGLLLAVAFFSPSRAVAQTTAGVVGLTCAARVAPAAVDSATPLLGWRVESAARGWRQSAYQIRVASDAAALARGAADLWDSGRVAGEQSLQIVYAGKPLTSRQRVFWSVRVWDAAGQASPWSAPAEWTTGVLTNSEWQARWIGAPSSQPVAGAPLFRMEIRISKPVRRATARLASLGWGQIFINGRKVGDDVLGAPFSDLNRRILYVTRDVTPLLQTGENAIGLTVGNGLHSPVVPFGGRPDKVVVPGGEGRGYHMRFGRFGPPAVLMELEVQYVDGTSVFYGTGSQWKTSPGPITFNDLWRGETQDRRLHPEGWNSPGFEGSKWWDAVEIKAPTGVLEPSIVPPIHRREVMKPDHVGGNTAVFEATGAGWPRLVVEGKPGQKIRLAGVVGDRFKLPPLEFILRGGRETLEPSFQFNSSPRKLVVEGLERPLEKDDVVYQLVSTDLKSAGSFECSDPFFNDLHKALLRTHSNYVFGHPMDPTREKQAWTQDAQNMMDSAVYLTDVETLYRNWWRDMRANQTEDGYLGAIVPVAGIQTHDWNCPWWSGMIIWLPWRHYLYYGDVSFLREAYPAMKSYLGFLETRAAEGVGANGGALRGLPNPGKDEAATRDGLLAWGTGDWQGLARPPVTLTSTAAWYHYADITSKTASLLGLANEAATYQSTAEQIRERFNRKFLNQETGAYGSLSSQTAQVIPLALGLVPESHRKLTAARLADAVHAAKDHINTGFVGTPFLLQTLTETGNAELAAKVVGQRDFPGWGTLMNEGVFKENWKGEHALMPSLGGPVGAWFYQTILGIRPDPSGPGFKRILIKPEPVGGLTWARGTYDSVRGKILSSWKSEGGRFHLHVEIPANTTATVSIPAQAAEGIREGGKILSEVSGVRLLRLVNGQAELAVSSGTYQFESN